MATLHPDTFAYLKPTDDQMLSMTTVRVAVARCARSLDQVLSGGPDKTYVLRMLRDVGMWANVAITRQPDGSPRPADDSKGNW